VPKSKILTITFAFIITSCSSFTGLNRKPASSLNLSCNELLAHFKKIEDLGVYNKFKKYSKYNDPMEFQKFEGQAYRKIKFWSDTGNRKISVQQMRHNGAFSSIRTAFNVDTSYAIARQFTPLFYEAETSFFIANRAFKEARVLEQLVDEIADGGAISNNGKLLLENYINTNLLTKKSSLALKDIEKDPSVLKGLLAKDMANLNEVMISYAGKLANIFDEYTVVRKYIDEQIIAGNPKASEVQERLKPSKLLSGCHLCGETSQLLTPNVAAMDVLANKLNIVRVMHLKKRILREKWLTVSSRLPTQYVYQLIDKVLQTVPFLNNSGFRKWLRNSFIDFKDKHRHFPNIDRLIFSQATEANLVDLMADIVGTEGKDFLITFARRVDAQDEWNKLYKFVKANVTEDPRDEMNILFKKMDDSWKEAVKRGPMAEWHNPTNSGVMRFVIDLAFYTSGLYVSYNYFTLQEVDEEGSRSIEVENTEVEMQLIEQMGYIVDEEAKKILRPTE
jgi:hypothetical protein